MQILLLNVLTGAVLALAVAFFSYKLKFLTFDGAVATFLLAVIIFGFGLLKWSVPVLTFFIPASMLSIKKTDTKLEISGLLEKPGSRNYIQVLSNGGIAVVFIFLDYCTKSAVWYLSYVVYLAAMASDTWATEIGTMKKRKTYNILTLRTCVQGESGGVSLTGFVAAFIGSVIVVLSSAFWVGNLSLLILITLVGFSGSVADSFLGAAVQAKYKCKICGLTTEKKIHCGEKTFLVKGKKWFNNDLVNITSGLLSVFILLLIYQLSF